MNTSDGTSHKIRLAEVAPPACASCSGQYVERRHVDFGAAFDGPTFPAPESIAGGKVMTVDDLVVCEECIKAAARLLDLVDAEPLESAISDLNEINGELSEKLAGAMAYVQQLEAEREGRQRLVDVLRPKART
jgi:hypothetical protein